MNVHVLLDGTFFATSVPIGDGQRLLPVPPTRGLRVGDTVFLRDEAGTMTWVGHVLASGETAAPSAWSEGSEDEKQRYAIVGYLARIHPDALPRGTSKLSARWVTLNRRTLPTTLPWWDDHLLVYHSTLRLVEGVFTVEQIETAAARGYLVKHPSGHWTVPRGEARKRIMVEILGVDLECGLCGGPIDRIESATQDHIIPISQGGPDTLANVQLAHRACNELKGNALPEQYPPFFPQPGQRVAAWYGRAGRSARGGRRRGGRFAKDRRPVPSGFQVATRDLASEAKTPEEAEDKKAVKSQPDKPAPRPSASERTGRKNGKKAAKAGGTQNGPAEEAPPPISEEERAWLADVQKAGLTGLQRFAKEPQWAARTASLRTLAQLPRARAGKARAQGTSLAEATGPKGRFQLLLWEDEHILVEERGRRQHVHLVQMCRAVSAEAYVSYLTRFGRTSPLAVILALLPLWQKGTPDEQGRLTAEKGDVELVILVKDDRIVQCCQETSVAAS